MQPVAGTQLVDHLELGTPLPDKPVMLSFDDASGGQYTNALPILRQLGMPATFFVMTVVLDRPNWLSRDDIRALDAAGMTIAAHTWDHHPVTKYGDKDWAIQLDKPREQLEQIIGHDIDLFAYPYGLWNTAALPHVQAAGYRAAFQLPGQPPDPARLPRGCPFHPRCSLSRGRAICQQDVPRLRHVAAPARWAACHFAEEQLAGAVPGTAGVAS